MPLIGTRGAASSGGFGQFGGVVGPVTWSYITNTTSSGSDQITTSASIQVGDCIVLFDGATQTSSYPTSVIPSGFTSVSERGNAQSGYYYLLNISARIATSAGSQTLTGMAVGAGSNKCAVIFRPSNPSRYTGVNGTFDQGTSASEGSNTSTSTMPSGTVGSIFNQNVIGLLACATVGASGTSFRNNNLPSTSPLLPYVLQASPAYGQSIISVQYYLNNLGASGETVNVGSTSGSVIVSNVFLRFS